MEHQPLIQLRQARYFVAVAEELNYRRAAKRLGITPPALSEQIKQLESLVEIRLLERDSVRVRLTVSGEMLLAELRLLLQHERQLVARTKETTLGNGGILRLGYVRHLCQNFFHEALASYHMRFPLVEMALTSLAMENEQAAALEDGRVEVGFVYGDRRRRMKDIGSLLILEAPVCAVMAAHHPLTALKDVGMVELLQYPWQSGPDFHRQLLNILAQFCKGKPASKKIQTSEDLTVCVSRIIAGKSVSIMPKIDVLIQNPRLALRPIKDAPPDFRVQIHAIWKKAGVTPQALNFIETLRSMGVQRE